MKKIPGIPTTYKGIRFRSRLEARWAVMFDLVGFRWEYEPFDMPGWIPGFLLRFTRSTLVEVKPITEIDNSVCDEMVAARGGENHRLLLLGCAHDAGWICNPGETHWAKRSLADALAGVGGTPEIVGSLWAEACNSVQWRAR